MVGQTLFSSPFDNLPNVRSVKIVSRSVKSQRIFCAVMSGNPGIEQFGLYLFLIESSQQYWTWMKVSIVL